MWDSIAYTQCGTAQAVNAILEANEDYRDTVIFGAGVELTIPDYETPVTSILPPWRQ